MLSLNVTAGPSCPVPLGLIALVIKVLCLCQSHLFDWERGSPLAVVLVFAHSPSGCPHRPSRLLSLPPCKDRTLARQGLDVPRSIVPAYRRNCQTTASGHRKVCTFILHLGVILILHVVQLASSSCDGLPRLPPTVVVYVLAILRNRNGLSPGRRWRLR